MTFIIEHQAEICRLCSRDSGKTLADAAMGEIEGLASGLRSLALYRRATSSSMMSPSDH